MRARQLRLLIGVFTVMFLGLSAVPAFAHDGTNGLSRTGHDSPLHLTDEQLAAQKAAEKKAGADYVASGNVELLQRIPLAADGVGAKVVGHYLYVTSTKDLEIFDISDPGRPQRVGAVTLDVEFENEQVPTNGEVLGISGQTGAVTTQQVCPPIPDPNSGTVWKANCLALFDVRDKGAPKQVAAVPGAGDHTSTCVEVDGNTCAYMYGSSGSITDLRTVLADGTAKKLDANWQNAVAAQGQPQPKSCHNQTEVRPGVLLTACEPISLISVNEEDGGSITKPAVLGTADFQQAPDDHVRFVHGVEWAQGGTDPIMLAGGETNFTGVCKPDAGAFSTFRATGTPDHPTFTFADQYRPVAGDYLDGNPPDGTYSFGCSVHWFQPNPTFRGRGIVAVASYENGTRFLRIDKDGTIEEAGFFEPLGGSTSSPDWAPDNRTVYAMDYHRGLDVLRYNGPLYAPGQGGSADAGTSAGGQDLSAAALTTKVGGTGGAGGGLATSASAALMTLAALALGTVRFVNRRRRPRRTGQPAAL